MSPLSSTYGLIGLALVLGAGLAIVDPLLTARPPPSAAQSEQVLPQPAFASQSRAREPRFREQGLTTVMNTSQSVFDMPVFDLASLAPGYNAGYAQIRRPIDPVFGTSARPGSGTWLKFLPLPRRKPKIRANRPPRYDWSEPSVLQSPNAPSFSTLTAMDTSRAAEQRTIVRYNQAGYDALAKGHANAALRYFDQSLQLDPNQPLIHNQRGYIYKAQGRYKVASRAFGNAGQSFAPGQVGTAREKTFLSRPLRFSGYTVWRQDSEPEAEISFGPSLAQSQSGIAATYRLPIAGWASTHELSAYTRLLWAYEPSSLRVNAQSYQAGVGVQLRPFSNLNLVTAAERLIAAGDQARDDWLLRASYSAGAGYAPLNQERSWLHWSVYGDAAIIDPAKPDVQVTGEARIGVGKRPFKNSPLTVIPFAGMSANFQDASGITTSLYEAGAGVWLRYWPGGISLPDPQRALDLRLEYRGKMGGDSASSSGLRFTLGMTY